MNLHVPNLGATRPGGLWPPTPEPPAGDEQAPPAPQALRLVLSSGHVVDTVIADGSLVVEDDPDTEQLARLDWQYLPGHSPQLRYVNPADVTAVLTLNLNVTPADPADPAGDGSDGDDEPPPPPAAGALWPTLDTWPGDTLIGARLRRLRLAAELPQEHVAEHLRRHGYDFWSRNTVSAVEHGQRPLRLGEAVAITDLYGITAETLFAPPGREEGAA